MKFFVPLAGLFAAVAMAAPLAGEPNAIGARTDRAQGAKMVGVEKTVPEVEATKTVNKMPGKVVEKRADPSGKTADTTKAAKKVDGVAATATGKSKATKTTEVPEVIQSGTTHWEVDRPSGATETSVCHMVVTKPAKGAAAGGNAAGGNTDTTGTAKSADKGAGSKGSQKRGNDLYSSKKIAADVENAEHYTEITKATNGVEKTVSHLDRRDNLSQEITSEVENAINNNPGLKQAKKIAKEVNKRSRRTVTY